MELLATAELLREELPDLKVRFVNVTDLFSLALPEAHPRRDVAGGLHRAVHEDKPVIFNFHGYPSAVHQLIHRRPKPGALPRARLRGGGHHHHAVRPAGDERRRPLPARHRGPEPRRHRTPRRRCRACPASSRCATIQGAQDTIEQAQAKLEEHRAYIRDEGNDPPEILELDVVARTAPGPPDCRLARSVYITAMEPHSGKSVVALGLVEMLSTRVERVGFFRPIVGSGGGIDPQIELMRRRYQLDAAATRRCTRSPTTRPRRRSRAASTTRSRSGWWPPFASSSAAATWSSARARDFTGASPALDFELNADLANELGCPVLVVVAGAPTRRGRCSRAVARESLERKGCELFGVIVNRVPAELSTEVSERGPRGRGRVPVYVLPEQPELAYPTVAEVRRRCRCGARIRSAASRAPSSTRELLQRDVAPWIAR